MKKKHSEFTWEIKKVFITNGSGHWEGWEPFAVFPAECGGYWIFLRRKILT